MLAGMHRRVERFEGWILRAVRQCTMTVHRIRLRDPELFTPFERANTPSIV